MTGKLLEKMPKSDILTYHEKTMVYPHHHLCVRVKVVAAIIVGYDRKINWGGFN